jgi:hypothetical protein
MSSVIVAAFIAAGASVLTLIGTLAAQHLGRRATSRDTEQTLKEQSKQLDRTLAEQSKQLDRTLAEQRTRTLNERFATAADRLGSDKPPAIRLAAVYAMAGLADDWRENRQACVDVLCAYLRIPYEPNPGDMAAATERLVFDGNREVRSTVIRVITQHLRGNQSLDVGEEPSASSAPAGASSARSHRKQVAQVSWQGLDFDFSGVVFDSGSFSEARFSGGRVQFSDAEFHDGIVSFNRATFSGSYVSFHRAKFSGGTVRFHGTVFSGGQVDFDRAEFSGGQVDFDGAVFSGGQVDFSQAVDWSHPPLFPWDNTPPSGVKLPAQPGASPPDSTSGGADSPLPAGS